MNNLFKLILKYHFSILFVILEMLAFYMIIQHNHYQGAIFAKQSNAVFGRLSSYASDVRAYFHLRRENVKLVEENTALRNEIWHLESELPFDSIDTTLFGGQYNYICARAVNVRINRTKNYITIDKGSADGIAKEMAVTSADGIVGIVQNVSGRFSVIQPLINTNSRVSAKIKKNGFYGSLQWDGEDYRYSYLKDIAFQAEVETGDTIVTSGFSSMFPEGELVGFVETVNRETANFLTIKVKLATDFGRLSDIYVVGNRRRVEKETLERVSYDER